MEANLDFFNVNSHSIECYPSFGELNLGLDSLIGECLGENDQKKLEETREFDILLDDIIKSINEETQMCEDTCSDVSPKPTKYTEFEPRKQISKENDQIDEKKYDSFADLFQDIAESVQADNKLLENAIIENQFTTEKDFENDARTCLPANDLDKKHTISSNCSSVGTYFIPKINRKQWYAKTSNRNNFETFYRSPENQNVASNDIKNYHNLETYYVPLENRKGPPIESTASNHYDLEKLYVPNENHSELSEFTTVINYNELGPYYIPPVSQNVQPENETRANHLYLGPYYAPNGNKNNGLDTTKKLIYNKQVSYLPPKNQNKPIQFATEANHIQLPRKRRGRPPKATKDLNYKKLQTYCFRHKHQNQYQPPELADESNYNQLEAYYLPSEYQNIPPNYTTELENSDSGPYYALNENNYQHPIAAPQLNANQLESYYLPPKNQIGKLKATKQIKKNKSQMNLSHENKHQLPETEDKLNENQLGSTFIPTKNQNAPPEENVSTKEKDEESAVTKAPKIKIRIIHADNSRNFKRYIPKKKKTLQQPVNPTVNSTVTTTVNTTINSTIDTAVLDKNKEHRDYVIKLANYFYDAIQLGKLPQYFGIDSVHFNRNPNKIPSIDYGTEEELRTLHHANLINKLKIIQENMSMAATDKTNVSISPKGPNESDQTKAVTDLEKTPIPESQNVEPKSVPEISTAELIQKLNIKLPIIVKRFPHTGKDLGKDANNLKYHPKKPSKAGRKPNPNSKRNIEMAARKAASKEFKRLPLTPLTPEDVEEMRRLSCLSPYGMLLEIKRVQDEFNHLSKFEARELTKAKSLKVLYFYRRRRRKPNEPPKKYSKKKKEEKPPEETFI